MKNIYRILVLTAAAIILSAFAACSNAPADNAFVSSEGHIADDSASAQTYIEVSREGEIDKIPVEIVSGNAADYTIAMDPEYFVFSSSEDSDCFTYQDWNGELNVYYCIYTVSDMTAQDLAAGLKHQNGDNYSSCSIEQTKIGVYDATAVYCSDDINFSDYQMHFFIIDNTDGCIVIETQFTFEMYEGLYAIMRECFDTLTLNTSN